MDKYKHRVIVVSRGQFILTWIWTAFGESKCRHSARLETFLKKECTLFYTFFPGSDKKHAVSSRLWNSSGCQRRAWQCIELHLPCTVISSHNPIHQLVQHVWSFSYFSSSTSCSRLLPSWWQKSNILAKLIQFTLISSCLNLKTAGASTQAWEAQQFLATGHQINSLTSATSSMSVNNVKRCREHSHTPTIPWKLIYWTRGKKIISRIDWTSEVFPQGRFPRLLHYSMTSHKIIPELE